MTTRSLDVYRRLQSILTTAVIGWQDSATVEFGKPATTNWTPLSDSWPTLAIGAIAFAPSDNRTIYVATGEAVLSAFVTTGVGIMKSTDGGSSWNLLAA
jgi:hypothetical protein